MAATNTELAWGGMQNRRFSHGLSLSFSARRTVSSETTVPCRSMNRSVSSRRLQRAWPGGGVAQASATSCASWRPSRARRYCRVVGVRCRAASNPPATKARRTRRTVARLTAQPSRICSSGHVGSSGEASALSKIRAWDRVRAEAVPAGINRRNRRRSASVRQTTCLWAGVTRWSCRIRSSFMPHTLPHPLTSHVVMY